MEGEVENRVILTDKPYSASALTEAANFFNKNFAGHRFDQVRVKLRDELGRMRDDITRLMAAAVDAGCRSLIVPADSALPIHQLTFQQVK
jgi:heat-inducible transcriptional repressor